jgi:hypothetical protein
MIHDKQTHTCLPSMGLPEDQDTPLILRDLRAPAVPPLQTSFALLHRHLSRRSLEAKAPYRRSAPPPWDRRRLAGS